MKIVRIAIVFVAFVFAALAAPAYAQATRTWVSGVGDDVNPCSRTAPCKTFAGAISKTAAGGEINCLDPGGFGAVTITKSITIDCHHTEGGALAGGNGIVVNAGAADVVVIRGLDIFGVNPPSNGIRFIAGAALHVEDCVIRRFNAANSNGISFQPSGASQLFVTNTTITGNGNAATGGGILIQPTGAGGSARVTLSDIRVLNNANIGIRIDTTGNSNTSGVTVNIEDAVVNGNAAGILMTSLGTNPIGVMLVDSTVSNNNGTAFFGNGSGVQARVGNTTMTGNVGGVSVNNGSVLNTYGNNRVIGNPTVGAPNNGGFNLPAIATQ